jgi:hypothetical protein
VKTGQTCRLLPPLLQKSYGLSPMSLLVEWISSSPIIVSTGLREW